MCSFSSLNDSQIEIVFNGTGLLGFEMKTGWSRPKGLLLCRNVLPLLFRAGVPEKQVLLGRYETSPVPPITRCNLRQYIAERHVIATGQQTNSHRNVYDITSSEESVASNTVAYSTKHSNFNASNASDAVRGHHGGRSYHCTEPSAYDSSDNINNHRGGCGTGSTATARRSLGHSLPVRHAAKSGTMPTPRAVRHSSRRAGGYADRNQNCDITNSSRLSDIRGGSAFCAVHGNRRT